MTNHEVICETDDMRLRRFTPQDVQFIVQLNKDARVTECLFEGALLSTSFVARYFVNEVIAAYEGSNGLGSWIAEKRNAAGAWVTQGWFNLTVVPDGALQEEEVSANPQAMVELGSRLATSAWGGRVSTQIGSAIYCTAFLGFENPGQVNYLGKESLQFALTAERFSQWQQKSLKEKRTSAMIFAKSDAVTKLAGDATSDAVTPSKLSSQFPSRVPSQLVEENVS